MLSATAQRSHAPGRIDETLTDNSGGVGSRRPIGLRPALRDSVLVPPRSSRDIMIDGGLIMITVRDGTIEYGSLVFL